MTQPAGQSCERKAAPYRLDRGVVAQEEFKQRNEVGGRPVAGHIAFGKSEIAGKNEPPQGPPPMQSYVHFGAR
jgi:hypothetical protein